MHVELQFSHDIMGRKQTYKDFHRQKYGIWKVIQHMNEDHADSLIDIVWHLCGGLPIINATMVAVDYLGMTITGEVTLGNKGGYTKIRVPWQQPVTDRKVLKDVIVGMARAAGAAKKHRIRLRVGQFSAPFSMRSRATSS